MRVCAVKMREAVLAGSYIHNKYTGGGAGNGGLRYRLVIAIIFHEIKNRPNDIMIDLGKFQITFRFL